MGHWPVTMALSRVPSLFHSDKKMNRDLRGWAEVRANHLIGHKLVTPRGKCYKLMGGGGGGLGEPGFLFIHCATSAQPCSYEASLNRPSVPPYWYLETR